MARLTVPGLISSLQLLAGFLVLATAAHDTSLMAAAAAAAAAASSTVSSGQRLRAGMAARRHLTSESSATTQQQATCTWNQAAEEPCSMNPQYVASDQAPVPSTDAQKVLAVTSLQDQSCGGLKSQQQCEQRNGCTWSKDSDTCSAELAYYFAASQRSTVFCPGSPMDDVRSCAALPSSRCAQDARCKHADPSTVSATRAGASPCMEALVGYATSSAFVLNMGDGGDDSSKCLAAWLTSPSSLSAISVSVDSECAKYTSGSSNVYAAIFADAVIGTCDSNAALRAAKPDCLGSDSPDACRNNKACHWATDALADAGGAADPSGSSTTSSTTVSPDGTTTTTVTTTSTSSGGAGAADLAAWFSALGSLGSMNKQEEDSSREEDSSGEGGEKDSSWDGAEESGDVDSNSNFNFNFDFNSLFGESESSSGEEDDSGLSAFMAAWGGSGSGGDDAAGASAASMILSFALSMSGADNMVQPVCTPSMDVAGMLATLMADPYSVALQAVNSGCTAFTEQEGCLAHGSFVANSTKMALYNSLFANTVVNSTITSTPTASSPPPPAQSSGSMHTDPTTTSAAAQPESKPHDEDGGMSADAIAGIILAVLVGLVVIGVIALNVRNRIAAKKRRANSALAGTSAFNFQDPAAAMAVGGGSDAAEHGLAAASADNAKAFEKSRLLGADGIGGSSSRV